jgi:methionyl-tRNA formyltransferase
VNFDVYIFVQNSWIVPVKRIVFFGSDPIGLLTLRWLALNGGADFHLAATVCGPDRRAGRGMELRENPIAGECRRIGLEFFQPSNPRTELLPWLEKMRPDLGLVFAYGHILGQRTLDIPTLGFINLHASPLPELRGPSPIEGAILERRGETAVTLMRMVREMDAGDILAVEPIPMAADERAGSLREKVARAAVRVLEDHLRDALAGRIIPREQDAAAATYTQMIRKTDGLLDFHRPAAQLDAQIRAYEIWPGSFFEWKGEHIRVGGAEVGDGESDAAPGTILGIRGDCLEIVAGQKSILRCRTLQRPTRRMGPASSLWR